jgi:hypothetical protein
MDYELIKLILMLLGSAVIGGLIVGRIKDKQTRLHEYQARLADEVFMRDFKTPSLLQRQAD